MLNKKNIIKSGIITSATIILIFILLMYNNKLKAEQITNSVDSYNVSLEESDNIKTIISFGGKSDGIYNNKTAFERAAIWLKNGKVSGKKLIIPPGEYFTSEKINFSGIKNCTIDCLGEIISVKGIVLSGDEITATFKKITGDNKTSINNLQNVGLYVTAITNSNIKVDRISGYKNAVMMVGDALLSPRGVLYTTIDVGKVINSNTACLVTTVNSPGGRLSEKTGYVNENVIRIRWMDTNYGIQFLKGTNQSDRFNNNKIEYAGLEHIASDGITMEFSRGNLIYEPRNEDVKGLLFKETDCYDNKYIVSINAVVDKVKLDRRASYMGTLIEKDGSVFCQMFFKDVYGKPNYFITGGVESLYNRNGTLKATTNIININAMKPLEVTMSKSREFEGSIIYISANTKTTTIAIKNSNEEVEISDIGSGSGVFLLMYYGDKWHSSKLSDMPFTS